MKIQHRAIIIPDTHAPLIDKKALSCVLQAIKIIKPDQVIHLGDIGQWDSVNHYRHKKIRQPDNVEIAFNIRKDVKQVMRTVLNPIDKACDEAGVRIKTMLTGNHDRWLNNFCLTNPDYEHIIFGEASGYRFNQIFDWKGRGWTVQSCGKLLQIGHLNFYHGNLYGGINHARNHLLRMGVNIVYGHWHDVQTYHVTHADGNKGAWSLGCLSSLKPDDNEWLEHRPTNWSHAFGIVDWWGNGCFTVHSINIIKGCCSVVGQIIRG